MNVSILFILIVTGICCLIPGIFLSLKNLSMITDAISHSILLGIVIGFAFSGSVNSPILLFWAMVVGVVTSLLINWLSKAKKVYEDGATAIVFPLFFALAIILIALFFDNVHLDVDSVLSGEVIYAPLDTINLGGFSITSSLVNTCIVLIINLVFVTICFRGLKLDSYDPTQAKLSRFKVGLINLGLMISVSLTSVVSFQSIGSILVIALMIGPVVSAMIFSQSLGQLFKLSISFCLAYISIGYFLAVWFDVSVAGMIATIIGIGFMLCCLFKPQSGLITKLINHYKIKNDQYQQIIINLLTTPKSVEQISQMLDIDQLKVEKIVANLVTKQLVIKDKEGYALSTLGKKRVTY